MKCSAMRERVEQEVRSWEKHSIPMLQSRSNCLEKHHKCDTIGRRWSGMAGEDERGGMPPVLTAAPQHAHRRAGAASEVSGRTMKKVEPSPSTDSNQMRPPCCSTKAWQR